jgi:uncharacterized protein (TIGR02302 family)
MRSEDGRKTEEFEQKSLARRFERRVALSRFALGLERMWEASLWPFLVVAGFLIVSLFGLWGLLPPLLHKLLLFAFGAGLLLALLPLFRIDWPTRQEALRRLERHANVKHRPATSYEDKLSPAVTGETELLWSAHRERIAKIVAKLKPRWPDPRVDKRDPYALRAVAVLLLVVALAANGGGLDRLRQAFAPRAEVTASLLRLDAWVAPPVYTKLPPIVLADGTEAVGAGSEIFRALQVPERSDLIVRAHAPQGEKVTLATEKGDGSSPTNVEPKQISSGGLVEFNVPLTEDGTAEVRIGGATAAKWRFAMIDDEPPSISLMGTPMTLARGSLRLAFKAQDDNGVQSAEAHFALAEGELAAAPPPDGTEDPLRQPPVMSLPLPRANAKVAEGKATQDLTAHPWAGLKVDMTLTAHDQAGQSGDSPPYAFVLPERNFTKPLARAVIEQRKKLVRDEDAANKVALALDALTIGDDKAIEDRSVYLSLRNAYWRLNSDQSRKSIASVVSQLWDIALKIEDGALAEAERALKDAQDKLAEALENGASQEELDRLFDQLREAMSEYLQALAEQAKDNADLTGENDADKSVSPQDLEKMLDKMKSLAKSGSKDLAKQMLADLKDLMDQLQADKRPPSEKQKRAERLMRDLNDLIGKQNKLLNDTFAAKRKQPGQRDQQFDVSPPGQPMEWGPNIDMSQLFQQPREGEQGQEGEEAEEQGSQSDNGQGGQQGKGRQGMGGQGSSGKFSELGTRQGQLEEDLQSLMDRLRIEGADTPDQLEGAQDSMGDAEQSLDQGNLDSATKSQGQALDRLRQGAKNLADKMQENGQGQAGRGQSNNGRDPLGRPDRNNRPDLGLSTKVPDEIDIQRAREVLDEVRKRLGDPSRPTLELDYLERLLRSY